MKRKQIFKVSIDIIMTVLFLVLMAYHITGNRLHEWLGILLILLFIIHHILNWKWYSSLFKGRYTIFRSIMVIVNTLLFLSMAGMAVSGILLSHEVFGFLNIRGGAFGRRLHMVSTSWGFCLMAVHIGFHMGMVIGTVKKKLCKGRKIKKAIVYIVRLFIILISVYGIYSFITRGIIDRMFLLTEYAFFDFGEPAFLFFTDYVSILVLFATLSYYFMKVINFHKTGDIKDKTTIFYQIVFGIIILAGVVIPVTIKIKNNKIKQIENTQTNRAQELNYEDGVYHGTGKGFGGEIEVELQIQDGRISSIKVVSANKETKQFLNKAETLLEDIIEKQDGNVDAVSGATYSSNGIIEGVKDALEQAEY